MDLSFLEALKNKLTAVSTERTLQLLSNINVILAALPDAGYEVEQLDLEVGTKPKLTANLKIGSAIHQEKLQDILAANPNNFVLKTAINALIRASQLQDAVSVNSLVLQDIKLVVTVNPTVTLQWREKALAQKAAA